MTKSLLLAVVVALMGVRSASAGPDWKAFQGEQGCAAIPYDNLRKDCVAAQKTEAAVCGKPTSCDDKAPDLQTMLQPLRQTRKQSADTDKKRVDDSHRKSVEGGKAGNKANVDRAEADIEADTAKIHKLDDDANAMSSKFRQVLDDRLANDRDCIRAHAEVGQTFADALDQMLDDVAPETLADAVAVADQLTDALVNEAPKAELVAQVHGCEDARAHPLELETGSPVHTDECLGAGGFSDKLLVFGRPEHKAQRWCDYQRAHSEKYPHPTDKVEGKWSKQYDNLVAISQSGKPFEDAAIARLAKEGSITINRNMLMRDSNVTGTCADGLADGFIPDGVVNATTLTWGSPYQLIEVKNRNDLGYTGNLKKMMDYVDKCDGSTLTLIIREKGVKPETLINGKWNNPSEAEKIGLAPRLQKLMEAGKMWVIQWPEP